MTDTVETIEISPTVRLRVEYDTGTQCPRDDWDMLTGFVKIHGQGDSRRMDVPAVHDDVYRLAEAHDHFDFENNGPTSTEDDVIRYAKIFHNKNVVHDSEHGGYWFVQWNDETSGDFTAEGETIAAERKTYETWAEGQVYGVIVEEKRELYRLDENGVPFDEPSKVEWEETDSLWGCYLDDEYTAEQVAEENFGITKES